MNVTEGVADRLPNLLKRSASAAAVTSALVGTAFLFAATVFGSVLWAVGGIGAFTVAAFMWHVAAIAGESLSLRRTDANE